MTDYRLFPLSETKELSKIVPMMVEADSEIRAAALEAPFGGADPEKFAHEEDWTRAMSVAKNWNPEFENEPFIVFREHMEGFYHRDAAYLYRRDLDGNLSLFRYTVARKVYPGPSPWDRTDR